MKSPGGISTTLEDVLLKWREKEHHSKVGAQEPLKVLVLKGMAMQAEGHPDRDLLLDGMVQMYDRAHEDIYRRTLNAIESAAGVLADTLPMEIPYLVETVLECHDPIDVWVAKNGLLMSEKFRATIREVLLVMGNKPAGDLTLEAIMRAALELIITRAMEKARTKEPEPKKKTRVRKKK